MPLVRRFREQDDTDTGIMDDPATTTDDASDPAAMAEKLTNILTLLASGQRLGADEIRDIKAIEKYLESLVELDGETDAEEAVRRAWRAGLLDEGSIADHALFERMFTTRPRRGKVLSESAKRGLAMAAAFRGQGQVFSEQTGRRAAPIRIPTTRAGWRQLLLNE